MGLTEEEKNSKEHLENVRASLRKAFTNYVLETIIKKGGEN
jgi:hypothetical protein